MASDVVCCDWLRNPGNDVQLHLVVVIRYKSAERLHVQLQFHPDFQREKVRKLAPQPLVRRQSVGLPKFDANWYQVGSTPKIQFLVGVSASLPNCLGLSPKFHLIVHFYTFSGLPLA